MIKSTGKTKKVYVPVLFDNEGNYLTDGVAEEDFSTKQEAENFAAAMISEFIEETGEECYVVIENRIIPVYNSENNEEDI